MFAVGLKSSNGPGSMLILHFSAYIITPSTALHLLSTSLPAHVLQPSLFHKSPYKPFPFPKWDAIDIWLSNKPAKNALYTVVLHPPVFWQVANGKAQGPSELLNSVRAEVLKRQGRVESDEEKKKIEKERGEREEDKRKGIVQLPDGWTIQD